VLGTGAYRLEHFEVVVAVEVRVDATLKADLGGTGVLCLHDAPGDLVELEQVGAATKVQRQRTFGERAELALERADVCVVDVPVHHEGDHIADRPSPQLVRDFGDRDDFATPGGEQLDDLVLADLLTSERALEHFAHGSAGAGPRVPARVRWGVGDGRAGSATGRDRPAVDQQARRGWLTTGAP